MLSRFQPLDSWLRAHDPRLLASCAVAILLLAAGIWWFVRRRRPSSDELERRRRERLANWGRITDGSLLDARTLDNEESSSAAPEVLVYRYRIAGVVYECAQDVSRLDEQVRGCHVGAAVQVRYDPRSPGDSIVLAESWSGLWLPNRPPGTHLADPSLSGPDGA